MVAEKIRELRIQYEREKVALRGKHEDVLRGLRAQLSKANAVDYAAPYRARYADFCAAMESYYQKILRAEKDVHGLSFYTAAYLPTVSERELEACFETEHVEKVFLSLMETCREVAEDLEEPHAVEEYAELLRAFCDFLALMRYVVKHSAELLRKSGLPDEDRRRAVSEIEAQIENENESYEYATRKENLGCFERLLDLAAELEGNYKKTSTELLGNVKLGDDEQYRYLIGFHVEKISEEDTRFCEEVLGVEREKLGREPIYLEPHTGRYNVIINAPGEFLSSRAYEELMRNLYFSVASRADKSMLQFGYIDCHRGPSALQTLYTGIDASDPNSLKRLGGDGSFCYSGAKERDPSKLRACLDTIYNDSNNIVSHYGNVIDYNLAVKNNKIPLTLIAVNFYPIGFHVTYGDFQPYSALQMQMKEYGDSGYMFVVCRDINAPLEKDDMMLDAKSCNAVEISLDEESYAEWKASGKPLSACEFTVDGRPATVGIASSEFDGLRYWDTLKQYYSKKEAFLLKDVFQKTKNATDGGRKTPSVFEDRVIEIPLGLKGSEDYCLRYPISTAGHTLVYGGSGSGKSSFLHSLILSLCYKYSSDEVQIYLADFKKTEFSFYARYPLPHIKYYLIKPGVSEVCAIFDMIDRIRLERGALLEKYGCADIEVYNKMVRENNDGTMEKMPVIFFIVDEYQVMDTVTGAGRTVMSKIYKAINTTLSQARAMGINIFLCAQDINKISEIQSGNVKTFILMGTQVETDRPIREYFLNNNSSMEEMRNVKEYLAVAGEGRCIIKAADGIVADRVRFAYAGKKDEDKAEYVEAIRELRKSEETSMVLGGSEEPVAVSTVSDYREGMLKDSPKCFSMSLGIGSTSGFALPMTFDTNEMGEHYGWMVYSEETSIVNKILRNATLAFLYKTGVLGYRYRDRRIRQRVIHFATGRQHDEVLGERYLGKSNAFDLVGRHIKKVDINQSLCELCALVMDLGDELERRKAEMNAKKIYYSETKDYPPYLVVLQSLGWLNKESIDNAFKSREGEKKVTEVKKPKPLPADDFDTNSEASMDAFISASIESNLNAISEKVNSPSNAGKHLKGAEVIKKVEELFAHGSQYGIFVIANPESRACAANVFGAKAAKAGAYWENGVFGTFEEYINDEKTQKDGESSLPDSGKKVSEMICYVGRGGVKTRMYDYSPEGQSDWWKEMETAMREGYYSV